MTKKHTKPLMPDQQYLSDNQVAAKFGVGRITIWRWARTDPAFPKPISLSAGCTRWKLADIEAWESSRPAAA